MVQSKVSRIKGSAAIPNKDNPVNCVIVSTPIVIINLRDVPFK
jgi:adenylosuccinate lyase